MSISIIVAIGNQGQIGVNNRLPWKLKEDLENFRKLTIGNVVIFGRKTFESIGRPLPNRINVVITRQKNYKVNDIYIFNSLDKAIDYFENKNIFIAGGEDIYKEALNGKYLIDNLYITHVDYNGPADKFFPKIDLTKWQLISADTYKKDDNNDYNYKIEKYIFLH